MRLSGRLLVTVLAALACIIAVGLLSLSGSPGPGPANTSAAAGTGTPGSTAGAVHGDRKNAAKGDNNGAGKNTVTDGRGSEVIRQPEGSAKGRLPGLTGTNGTTTKSRSAPLIGTTLPRTASRRGAIVAGFPLTIVPLATGSSVRSSGLSATATTLQVSIQAVSSAAPDVVLAFYRAKLSAIGFDETAVPAVGGSTAAGFEHNADNLVVTTTKSRSGGTRYSVFGTLHTGSS